VSKAFQSLFVDYVDDFNHTKVSEQFDMQRRRFDSSLVELL